MKRTILILIALSCSTAFAVQDPNAVAKLRLAQNFEEAQEWERAMPLYDELYRSDPNSFVYAEGLKRSCVQLKQYGKAIAVVVVQLQSRPNDAALRVSLGGLYYDAGDESRADSVWAVVIARDPKNPNIYRSLASQLMERRLYDRTIKTYADARTNTGNDGLFADELGLLYSYMQQYTAATREFIKSLRNTPELLGMVQSRISSFTIRSEGLGAATEVTDDELRRSPDNITLHTLRAWLAMESKNFDTAFEEYQTIDRTKKANGAEMFNFATRAFQERAYAVSAKSQREVMERSTDRNLIPQARYGYALAIEQLSDQTDSVSGMVPGASVSETQPTFSGALALYQQIVSDYPNAFVAGAAQYRIGLIFSERMNDLDRALEAFQNARTVVRGNDLTYGATMKIA